MLKLPAAGAAAFDNDGAVKLGYWARLPAPPDSCPKLWLAALRMSRIESALASPWKNGGPLARGAWASGPEATGTRRLVGTLSSTSLLSSYLILYVGPPERSFVSSQITEAAFHILVLVLSMQDTLCDGMKGASAVEEDGADWPVTTAPLACGATAIGGGATYVPALELGAVTVPCMGGGATHVPALLPLAEGTLAAKSLEFWSSCLSSAS